MKKKIIFVTATRADFGKLKSLINTVKKSKKFDYQIAVTGMHLSKTMTASIAKIALITENGYEAGTAPA